MISPCSFPTRIEHFCHCLPWDKVKYLDPFQSGFIPRYGTEKALVALLDDFWNWEDGGLQWSLLYLISWRLLISFTMIFFCISSEDLGWATWSSTDSPPFFRVNFSCWWLRRRPSNLGPCYVGFNEVWCLPVSYLTSTWGCGVSSSVAIGCSIRRGAVA